MPFVPRCASAGSPGWSIAVPPSGTPYGCTKNQNGSYSCVEKEEFHVTQRYGWVQSKHFNGSCDGIALACNCYMPGRTIVDKSVFLEELPPQNSHYSQFLQRQANAKRNRKSREIRGRKTQTKGVNKLLHRGTHGPFNPQAVNWLAPEVFDDTAVDRERIGSCVEKSLTRYSIRN